MKSYRAIDIWQSVQRYQQQAKTAIAPWLQRWRDVSWRRFGVVLAVTSGMVVAKDGFRPSMTLAPPPPCQWLATLQPPLPPLDRVESIAQLTQMNDRLSSEIDRCNGGLKLATLRGDRDRVDLLLLQRETLARRQQAIRDRLQLEAKARSRWERASQLAAEAVKVGETPDPSTQTWRQAQSLWQQSVDALRSIPNQSLLAPPAKQKMKDYRNNLAIVTEKVEIAQLATGFILSADTNRDGIVDDRDYSGRQLWTWESGALTRFNNDDDNGNRRPDWQDKGINGDADAEDLALVRLKVDKGFAGSQLLLEVDKLARSRVNVYQRTASGWQSVDGTAKQPLAYSNDIVLGVEATQFADGDWDGLVTLKAIARRDGKRLTADKVQLRVAPWLMAPNTAEVKEFFVSERSGNRAFVDAIRQIVPQTGATVKVVPGGPVWMQDTMEIGYVQFPDRIAPKTIHSVLKGNRGVGRDNYAKSLLKDEFGWFEVGKPRLLGAADGWSDWYGNLEVTPPLPGYPFGRVYYGNSGTATMHPQVVEFIKAQQLQGPPVEIDTSWLLIRHVDEVMSFIPTPSGEPLLLVASPGTGVELLRELDENGHGNQVINRGLSTQTTVKAALNNQALIARNLKIQQQHIEPIIAKAKQEFGLSRDRIVEVPAMFGPGGYAWFPNMVNSTVVNGTLLASSPQGAIVDGKDYTQERFKKLVARSQLQVRFLPDKYYQEMRGNTHCATNATRKGMQTPFWENLPDRLRSQQ